MPKAGPEMVVITKFYDLVLWSCNHIARFPRSHRFTLGERISVGLPLVEPRADMTLGQPKAAS